MSERRVAAAVMGMMLAVASEAVAELGEAKCAADAVVAGTICLDRYEASMWRVSDPTTTHADLVRKIQLGSVTRGDLTSAGARQLGSGGDDYAPCADDGRNCADDIYAVSIPSVAPAAFVSWFQAQEACANSGKRLPTSAEWQIGANGSPDPGPDDETADCNTARGAVSLTGERSRCVSARGAFDMVGNTAEWVADWVPLSTDCPGWGSFSDDFMCLAGANESKTAPGALLRGGHFFDGAGAGPLTVLGTVDPTRSEDTVGFRCAHALPEPGRPVLLCAGMQPSRSSHERGCGGSRSAPRSCSRQVGPPPRMTSAVPRIRFRRARCAWIGSKRACGGCRLRRR